MCDQNKQSFGGEGAHTKKQKNTNVYIWRSDVGMRVPLQHFIALMSNIRGAFGCLVDDKIDPRGTGCAQQPEIAPGKVKQN